MHIHVLIYLALGAITGILSGMLGIGGGVILTPALVMVFSALGFPSSVIVHLAAGTTLATIVPTMAASAWSFHRRGAVEWTLVKNIVPFMVVGAVLGAVLAFWIPTNALKAILAIILIFSAFRFIFPVQAQNYRDLPSEKIIAVFGLLAGLLAGLIGLGGSIIIIPFLSYFSVPMLIASGVAASCALPAGIAGVITVMITGYWTHHGISGSTGFIYWPAVILLIATSIGFVSVGARLAGYLPVNVLKRFFGLLLILTACKLII